MKESGPPCTHCGEPLRKNNSSGYHTKKRDCHTAYIRAWRESNPEKTREIERNRPGRRKSAVKTFDVPPNKSLWYDGDEFEPLSEEEFQTQYTNGRRAFREHDVPETFRDDPAISYTDGKRVRAYLQVLATDVRALRVLLKARRPDAGSALSHGR